jgi:Domain of unknown function (DUF4157)
MLARTSLTKEPPKWSAKSRSVSRLQASHFDSEKESPVHGQSKYDFRFGDVAIDVSDSQRKSARIEFVQPKLEVGAINDPLEREADRVAGQVMRGSRHGNSPSAPTAGSGHDMAPGLHTTAPGSVENTLSSEGRALDRSTRDFFESRLQWDLSRVRIHNDPAAGNSARSVGAKAYTAGSHIVFGPGQYSPGGIAGRHLIAHELVHVIQQTGAPESGSARDAGRPSVGQRSAAPKIQRQAVPREEFGRLIEEIDAKLADPKLSDEERLKLLRQRHQYYEYLRDLEDSISASGRFTAPLSLPKATPRFQSPKTTQSTPSAAPGAAGEKLKSIPSTGTAGNKAASVRAQAGHDSGKSTVPPPSTRYVEPITQPANKEEQAKRDEESAIGKRLNEMAVSGDLGDIRRVEGRGRVKGQESPDYAFEVKGGSFIYGDLYSPATSTPVDNVVDKVTEKKSAQGEILVLHLMGFNKPLEYAQNVAEALIVTPNHGLKRMIAFSDKKLLISRSLEVNSKALPQIQKRVEARREEQRKAEKVTRPEWAKPQQERQSKEPRKLSPENVEKLRLTVAKEEIRALIETDPKQSKEETNRSSRKGLFYDPRALDIAPKTGTGISTQGAVEGAGQMVLSAQLSAARDAELNKALDHWNALQPKIEDLRSRGFDVTITVVAQVPKQPDVAAYATGVGDATQVVYFEKMYITRFSLARKAGAPVAPSNRDQLDSVSPLSAEQSATMDKFGTEDRYDEPAWIDAMQEQYQIYGRAGDYKPPKKGFRFEVRDLTLPAHQ